MRRFNRPTLYFYLYLYFYFYLYFALAKRKPSSLERPLAARKARANWIPTRLAIREVAFELAAIEPERLASGATFATCDRLAIDRGLSRAHSGLFGLIRTESGSLGPSSGPLALALELRVASRESRQLASLEPARRPIKALERAESADVGPSEAREPRSPKPCASLSEAADRSTRGRQ